MDINVSHDPERDLRVLLKDARHLIENLNSTYCGDELIRQWYNKLCELLARLIKTIGQLGSQSTSALEKDAKKNTLLYLTQILTILSYLIEIFVEESNTKSTIIELRKYVSKRLLFCLDELEFTLLHNKTESSTNGNFIEWMDIAIEKVLKLNNGNVENQQEGSVHFDEVKASFEEVLSYGMSIAQVAPLEDCKIIKGTSQSVLEALSSLHCEIIKEAPNQAVVNLFREACINTLCKLEESVNLAVLKLCADVFCEYTTLLNKIHTFCFDTSNMGKLEELEEMVADFDLHVDRIMQIGLFVLSCSSEGINAIQIKSCLASLEALETELVPAFYTLLSDNTTENRCYANLLRNHWEHQANQLMDRIYYIVEPYTFCQVLNQKMATLVEQISTAKSRIHDLESNANCYTAFLNYGRLLKDFITVILSVNIDQIEKDKLITHLTQYKQVLNETNTALDVLLPQCTKDAKNYHRILKRCKIVITLGKILQSVFEEDSDDKENRDCDSISQPKKDTSQVNNKFLEHIIDKGKQILNERSILYKTPRKNALKTRELTTDDISINCSPSKVISSISLVRQRSTMSFTRNSKKDITFDFTGILNDITNLSISNGGARNV